LIYLAPILKIDYFIEACQVYNLKYYIEITVVALHAFLPFLTLIFIPPQQAI